MIHGYQKKLKVEAFLPLDGLINWLILGDLEVDVQEATLGGFILVAFR